nr:hypothetical protein GCM10020092_042950 [Actinoplanes digitatis]
MLARLRRRAYRIIWMNPRAGAPGFAPRVGSMAAALPFCDRLLPAGTFRDLDRVAEQIADSAKVPTALARSGQLQRVTWIDGRK